MSNESHKTGFIRNSKHFFHHFRISTIQLWKKVTRNSAAWPPKKQITKKLNNRHLERKRNSSRIGYETFSNVTRIELHFNYYDCPCIRNYEGGFERLHKVGNGGGNTTDVHRGYFQLLVLH